VADQQALLAGGDQPQLVQVDADGLPLDRVQHHPDQPGRRRPALAGAADPPAAVHPQVAVQGPAVIEAGQQVFTAGERLDHGAAGDIDRGELRHPELAGREHGSAQRPVEGPRGQPYGVTFRHSSHSSWSTRADPSPPDPGGGPPPARAGFWRTWGGYLPVGT